MAVVEAQGIEGLKALVGKVIGPGEWREVRQEDIDAFADLSGDHQWIHTDVERAQRESPFGTTIAHGNLTLSMIDGFRLDLISSSGFALGVNYGWNKVRFPAPGPGRQPRARAGRGGLGRRGGRQLVAGGDAVHRRGRGRGKARLCRGQRGPRAGRLTDG